MTTKTDTSRPIAHTERLIGAVDTLLYLQGCDNAHVQSLSFGNPSTVVIHAKNFPHEKDFLMPVWPNTTYEELSKLVEKKVEEIDNWIKSH
jgi:hypothetical protein